MKETAKRGRPPKPANSCKSRTMTIKLTPAEDVAIREAAAEEGLTLRDFLVTRSLTPIPKAPA